MDDDEEDSEVVIELPGRSSSSNDDLDTVQLITQSSEQQHLETEVEAKQADESAEDIGSPSSFVIDSFILLLSD